MMQTPSKEDLQKLEQVKKDFESQYKTPQDAMNAMKQMMTQGKVDRQQLDAFAKHISPALDQNMKKRLDLLIKQITGNNG